ncbi:hypothetical protein ACFVT2_26845 [Streptomyces sp. NPDC058000]|uniref:hypothetical protein n=1 Tax=Streptomyces sp. NPDC058000 TaxID=3346299 RepID=UPI0036E503E3
MRKLQKTVVVSVALGGFGFLCAGTAYADGGRGDIGFDVRQGSQCRSHDTNVDVLGEVGILNGVLGNALGGEGSPGAQSTRMGSSMGCDNSVVLKGDDEDRGRGSEGREGRGDDEDKGRGSEGREGRGDDEGKGRGSEDKGRGSEGREGNGGKEGKAGGEGREGGEGPVRAVGGGDGE